MKATEALEVYEPSQERYQVETFECHEVMSESHPEVKGEALALIEELCLVGQQISVEGKRIRMPFREMSADEMAIYKTLCPKEYDIGEYSRTPIPLRVLQTLKFANGLGCFQEFKIWDVEDQAIKDPVLVARKGNGWREPYFILARWGEVLEDLSVLKKKALEIARGVALIQMKSILAKVKTDIELLENGATENLIGSNGVTHFSYS